MKKFIVVFMIFVFSSSTVLAGEIYTYKNKKGVTIISNEPVPEEYENKANKLNSYERDSPEAIAAFQRKQREAEDKSFRGWQASQSQRRQAYSTTNNTSKTPETTNDIKCKELGENYRKASQEYEEEKKQRLARNGKAPSSKEKALKDAMFDAMRAEHSCIFSKENIEDGKVYKQTVTTTGRKR